MTFRTVRAVTVAARVLRHRGGIVRDDGLREGSAEKVAACAAQLGLELAGRMESPIEGRKGNREMLAWFHRRR